MGNLQNSNTGTLNMFEQQESQDKLPKNIIMALRNTIQNQRKMQQPKNKKKENIQIQHCQMSPAQKINTQQILAKLHGLSTERQSFQQIWDQTQQLLGKFLKFTLMFPSPLNSQGQQILKSGSFYVYWLKILEKNPCVNISMVYKNVRQRYQPKVTHQKQYLQQFLKQQQNSQQTPLKKSSSNELGLKRSALKKSLKKVQFGKDEVVYPYLEQYKNLNIPIQNKKQITRSQHGFLIDYFEINDIYLLEQVTVVGVVKQFDDTYAIIQVKLNKQPFKEVTCIAVIAKQNIKSHSLKTLQEIEKQYENLSFLELEGRCINSL